MPTNPTRITSLGPLSPDAIESIAKKYEKRSQVFLFLLHGSWLKIEPSKFIDRLSSVLQTHTPLLSGDIAVGTVALDDSDNDVIVASPFGRQSIELLISRRGEKGVKYVRIESHAAVSMEKILLTFAGSSPSEQQNNAKAKYSVKILLDGIMRELSRDTMSSPSDMPIANTSPVDDREEALRIFISGDRSHVGKSSICLGLLGSLLRMGYHPSSIAYIKPATQCEAPGLVEQYCQKWNIPCVPIGPIVYFKGFTRQFLAGKTESSQEMLQKAGIAIDELSLRKRVVIIDGVGYPSVGSICGTCNAGVASVSGRNTGRGRLPVPVLLVGKSGVGDAVDSYNINAAYFQSKNVPVLGVVFNRLALEGFYSLENCKTAVTAYFDLYKKEETVFGFLPELDVLKNVREDGQEGVKKGLDCVETFLDSFMTYVDVASILERLKEAQMSLEKECGGKEELTNNKVVNSSLDDDRIRLTRDSLDDKRIRLTREQIETAAENAGAAGG